MNVPDVVFTNIVGLVVGVVASFCAWLITFRWLVPKIEFSSAISSIPRRSDPNRRSYRIKIMNTGKRAIIGVEVFARLSVNWERGNGWSSYYIPLNPDADRKNELPRIASGRHRILTFWINKVEMFKANKRFPEAFQKRAKDGQLTLEDLLSLGEKARLQLTVSGYDEFSGARKVFESMQFTAKDIQNGHFKGLNVDQAQTEQAELSENSATGSLDDQTA